MELDRDTLDRWCEWAIFGLAVAVLIYAPTAFASIRPREFAVVGWLVALIAFVWAFRFLINPSHRLYWPMVSWGVVAFVIYAGVRYLTADIEYVARQEWLRILVYGLWFLAITHNLHRQEKTQLLALVVIGWGTLLAFYAIYQFITASPYVLWYEKPDQYFKRGSATFVNPNHCAGHLEMLLPLAIMLTVSGRLNHLTKVFLGYSAFVMFAGVLVTVSRGGWVSMAVGLAVVGAWLLRKHSYRLPMIMFGAGLAVVLGGFALKAKFSADRQKSLQEIKRTENYRLLIWPAALQMWKDHLWWGVGPAHFDYVFPQYRPTKPYPDRMQLRPGYVHNDYLNTLTDYGLIGGVLVALALGLFALDTLWGWKYMHRPRNDLVAKPSNRSALVIGGLGGLAAIAVHSFVDFNLHMPANALLAVTLMALVACYFRFATDDYWQTVHWPLRIPIVVILLASGVYLAREMTIAMREGYWLGRAKETPKYTAAQLEAYRKAFDADPYNYRTAYRIGEIYRIASWDGQEGYRELAEAALKWHEVAIELNPLYAYSYARYGMCLDWLGQHDEAEEAFKRALQLDPNGYFTVALVGWHYVQREQWAKAKEYFERSLQLYWTDNPIAKTYLPIVKERLAENSAL